MTIWRRRGPYAASLHIHSPCGPNRPKFERRTPSTRASHINLRRWYKFRNDDAAKAPLRFGKLVLFDDAASAVAGLSATVEGFGDELRSGLQTHSSWVADPSDETPVNTIHLLLKSNEATTDDKALVATLEQALAGVQNAVEAARLRSVNFVATDAPYYPRYFTFVNPY